MNSNLKGEHINYLNLLTHTWVIIQINYKCCCFPLVRESFSPSTRPQNSNFAVKQSSRLLNVFIYLKNYRKTFSFSVYFIIFFYFMLNSVFFKTENNPCVAELMRSAHGYVSFNEGYSSLLHLKIQHATLISFRFCCVACWNKPR